MVFGDNFRECHKCKKMLPPMALFYYDVGLAIVEYCGECYPNKKEKYIGDIPLLNSNIWVYP